jgi:tRNA(Ile)-lysidine synthase
VLRARRGRERLQLNQDGPSRSLKNVFQEHGVPNWQRARLPLAYLGDRLLWVAGIGFDTRMARRSGERLALRWEYHQEAKYFI